MRSMGRMLGLLSRVFAGRAEPARTPASKTCFSVTENYEAARITVKAVTNGQADVEALGEVLKKIGELLTDAGYAKSFLRIDHNREELIVYTREIGAIRSSGEKCLSVKHVRSMIKRIVADLQDSDAHPETDYPVYGAHDTVPTNGDTCIFTRPVLH